MSFSSAQIFRAGGILASTSSQQNVFVAQPVDTNAGTARWTRGADLTNNADGGKFSFSLWINPNTVTPTQNLYSTGSNEILLALFADRFRIQAENAAGTTIVNFQSPVASVTAGQWQHWMGGFELEDPQSPWLRKNGVDQVVSITTFTVGTPSGEAVNFTVSNHSIGANPGGGVSYNGKIAEVWIDNTIFIPNLDANVFGKFITGANGFPVDLGLTGQNPGFASPTSPIMYFSRRGPVSDWATNKGTGGGFSSSASPALELDGGELPSAENPGGTFGDAPITTRSPKLYLKLEESSGTPSDFAGAGYGGAISVVGAPLAYGVPTTKGFGIRLGTGAYIEAAHHSVFETPGAGTNNVIVESEVTFSIHCHFPATLQNNWVIFSKASTADGTTDLNPSMSLRVHANGSVELRVREWKYRPDVRMVAPAGTVVQGGNHHFTVSLGYEGAWFTVDGRQAELGFKNTLAWWGLDHRTNGVEQTGQAVSTRVTNTHSIRLGRTGDQSSSADIVVTKFAVFYSGTTRTARGQITAGFTLADAQALAGTSGAVLADPRFDVGLAAKTPSAGTNTIQAAIDAANADGGGTVILTGNYTQTVDLVLKSNVRITSAVGTPGGAVIELAAPPSDGTDAKITTAKPTAIPALPTVAIAPGDVTYNVTNSFADGDGIVILINTTQLQSLYVAETGVIEDPTVRVSDVIPVRSRTATTITLARGATWNFPVGSRYATRALTPTVTDIAIDGDITITKNGGVSDTTPNPNKPTMELHAVRRARFNGITIEQTNSSIADLKNVAVHGCCEIQFNGCTITDQSTDPDPTGGFHPYNLGFSSCSHHDVFNCTLFGRGWHPYDVQTGNQESDWGLVAFASPGPHWGALFGDLRNCDLSVVPADVGTKSVAVVHTCYRQVFLDLLLSTGGGISTDGYGHDIQGVVANSTGSMETQLTSGRGIGASRIWHCTFNNNLGNRGSGDVGLTNCSLGNLHYLTPVDTGTILLPVWKGLS